MIYLKQMFPLNQTINNEIVKRNKTDNRRKITSPEKGGNNIIYLGNDEDNFLKERFKDIYDLCEYKYIAQEINNKTLKQGEGQTVKHRIKTSLLKEMIGTIDEFFRINKSMYHNPNFDYTQILSSILQLGEYLEFESELVYIRDNTKPKPYFKWFDKEGFELFREFFIADITTYNIEIFKEKKKENYIFEWTMSFNPLILSQLLETNKSDAKILENTLKNTNLSNETYGSVVERMVKTRVGQSDFRKKLLSDPLTAICPFTGITNPTLLIASHIKPWSVSTPFEKADPMNGLMFTPTFDLLFDKGFISFTNEKKVLLSTELEKQIFEKVGLNPQMDYLPYLATEGREKYLEYHRNQVFIF